MTEILWNIGSFVLALGILVTIHEYGHFWVARKVGVKVLKFSVGFGKSIWSHRSKSGTEYTVAAIPLGGYVKMLDEREGNVASEDRAVAFNTQPVLSRIAIVIAGPAANFLFAILVYCWMYILGVPALKPFTGVVPETSIAYEAGIRDGDQILSVDGREVGSWQDVNHAIARRMGETGAITLQVQHQNESLKRDYSLSLANWTLDDKKPDLLGTLGLSPWTPNEDPILAEVTPGGAAEIAGLLAEDKIISINAEQTKTWNQMATIVRRNANNRLAFVIERSGVKQAIEVQVGSQEENGHTVGLLGVKAHGLTDDEIQHINNMRYRQEYPLFQALSKGVDKTWEITLLSFRLLGKLFTGEVSPNNLSGPISIAQGAGAYASFGFVFFLSFLGMISVNLGIINILPIPVLDGGHLMYYLIELIRGKPLSESVQEIGLRVGLLMVLSLMVFSIFNDISRL